jgi:nitroreductase
METMHVLLTRRSVRNFTDAPVTREDLEDIIQAGLYAPSAINTQPWFLTAVHSVEKMNRLREFLQTPARKLRPELEQRFPNHPEVVTETYQLFQQLGNAPACLMLFAYKPGIPSKDVLMSCAAAMENMLLCAWDKGIASCWMTGPINYGLNELLAGHFAQNKGDLLAIAPLGYPQVIREAPARREGRYSIL